MTEFPEFSSSQEGDKTILLQAFKQFSLETERLELAYQSLQDQFKSVQERLQETHTKLYGKLVELDFTTSYLDAILSHMSQGILFIDLNGIVTTYNSAAENMLGVPKERVLLHSFESFFPDTALGFSLKGVLASKQCPKMTYIFWTASSQQIELEVEATFVGMQNPICAMAAPGASSAPLVQGLLILLRNITDFRRLQIVANRYERLKELGEMAARVAHEIRNPLGGIKGFATLLVEDLKERPELQQMAAEIVKGTDNLGRVVSNLLNYTRAVQPHLELIDLIPYFQEVLQLMQADQSLPASISYQLQTSLSSLTIPIDPQLFKSALLNLLVNAAQAMPGGGKVTLKAEKIEDHVQIQIIDTGSGMPQEVLDKIFSPFFTTKENGNGLGLSEVYKVIQAHQGSIEVQSELGTGTTFTIKIPLNTSF